MNQEVIVVTDDGGEPLIGVIVDGAVDVRPQGCMQGNTIGDLVVKEHPVVEGDAEVESP